MRDDDGDSCGDSSDLIGVLGFIGELLLLVMLVLLLFWALSVELEMLGLLGALALGICCKGVAQV
jgi:hypothetical protein